MRKTRTYTDEDVRRELAERVAWESYRQAGEELGVDPGDLCRMVQGSRRVSRRAGEAVGFELAPRRWVRKKKRALRRRKA
jgi:hypothetical protein